MYLLGSSKCHQLILWLYFHRFLIIRKVITCMSQEEIVRKWVVTYRWGILGL